MASIFKNYTPERGKCDICCDSEMERLLTNMIQVVAQCETKGYNPNGVRLRGDPGKPVPQCTGAWGLFQMGKDGNPEQGAYDVGDVVWEEQVKTAALHLMEVRPDPYESYWACWTDHSLGSLEDIIGICNCKRNEENKCFNSGHCNQYLDEVESHEMTVDEAYALLCP